MMHHDKCPVSGSADIEKLFRAKDFTATGEKFDIMQSGIEGYRFTNPFPDAKELSRYYEADAYISHSKTKKGLVNRLFHIAQLYTMRFKKNVVRRESHLKRGTLLDYGCGAGDFLLTMQKAGWKAQGYEPDESARGKAINLTGASVYSPEELKRIRSGSFNCITLWHVLEHVYEPGQVIENLCKWLKPGGVILIALPNFRSFDAEHYGQYWAGYDVPRHLHHFAFEGFQYLANQHGLNIKAIHRMHLDAFYVSLLSEKYKGNGTGNFLGGLNTGFRSWMRSLRNKKTGSSILYVCEKK